MKILRRFNQVKQKHLSDKVKRPSKKIVKEKLRNQDLNLDEIKKTANNLARISNVLHSVRNTALSQKSEESLKRQSSTGSQKERFSALK